jgi:hypothetical protein
LNARVSGALETKTSSGSSGLPTLWMRCAGHHVGGRV